MQKLKRQSGLSLVEMIVTTAIIALLIVVASPYLQKTQTMAEITSVKHQLGATRQALALRLATEKVRGTNLKSLSYKGGPTALHPIHDLLSKKPKKYIGINPNDPVIGDEGTWRDRSKGRLLIYTLFDKQAITTQQGQAGGGYQVNGTANITYRIELVHNKDEYIGSKDSLVLSVPDEHPFDWVEGNPRL